SPRWLDGAHCRRHLRRPARHPQGGGASAARRAASVVPLPLSAGGCSPPVRGRPPRQEGTEKTCPRRAAHRAFFGRPIRRRGRSAPRLLRCRAQCLDRRRPAPSGSLGAAVAGAAVGGRGQPGSGGRKKGLPKELRRLRKLLRSGLEVTAALWPPITLMYAWV